MTVLTRRDIARPCLVPAAHPSFEQAVNSAGREVRAFREENRAIEHVSAASLTLCANPFATKPLMVFGGGAIDARPPPFRPIQNGGLSGLTV